MSWMKFLCRDILHMHRLYCRNAKDHADYVANMFIMKTALDGATLKLLWMKLFFEGNWIKSIQFNCLRTRIFPSSRSRWCHSRSLLYWSHGSSQSYHWSRRYRSSSYQLTRFSTSTLRPTYLLFQLSKPHSKAFHAKDARPDLFTASTTIPTLDVILFS